MSRKKHVSILEVKMPEKREMKVKAVIDMNGNPLIAETSMNYALNDTRADTIVIKDTKYCHEEYMMFPMGFDIETTKVVHNQGDAENEYCCSYMYIWMLGLGDYLFTGRTWGQWKHLMESIQKHFNLTKCDIVQNVDGKNRTKHFKRQAICWVCNAQFEFQFISKQKHNGNYIIQDVDEEFRAVFADKCRKPISFELQFNPEMGAGFRFLDTYRLTGTGLATMAKNYCITQKMKGDLDYTKQRNSKTPLTEEEMTYCLNDVKILIEWDYYYKDVFMKQVGFTPVTSTGLIRKAVEQNWNSKKYFPATPDGWLFQQFPQTLRDYIIAVEDLYRGGYTHANVKIVGQLLNGIRGMDFTSSYPAVMFQCLYPCEGFKEVQNIHTIDELVEFDKQYNNAETETIKRAWFAKITFHNIKAVTAHSIESYYKTQEYNECNKNITKFCNNYNVVMDNGKIYAMEQMTVTITESDFYSYCDFYHWDYAEVYWVKSAKTSHLPEYLTDVTKVMYKRKTVLKRAGLDETPDYTVAKGFVNGTYGLTVQKMHFEDSIFNPESGWCECHDMPNNEKADGKLKREEALADKDSEIFFNEQYLSSIRTINTDKNGCVTGITMKLHLSPYWGIYITSYARRRILKAIKYLDDDAVYSDTDSVYFRNWDKHKAFFEHWNKDMRKRNKNLFGSDYDEMGDLGTFDPVEIKSYDKKKYAEYSFMTYGAKRYVKYSEDDTVSVTVAGLPKTAMQNYALKQITGSVPDDEKEQKALIWEHRKEIRELVMHDFYNMIELSAEDSLKKTHCYVDFRHSDTITDEDGNSELMTEESSISLYEVSFKINVNQVWLAWAKEIQHDLSRF